MRAQRAFGTAMLCTALLLAGCSHDATPTRAAFYAPTCTPDQARGPATPIATPAASWDFNGDGRADTATVVTSSTDESSSAHTVSIYFSARSGLPMCQQVVHLVHHGVYEKLGSADVNGDGRSDLIVAVADRQAVTAYLSTADGFIDPVAQTVTSPDKSLDLGWSITSADFTDDGYDDIAVGAPASSKYIFLDPDGGPCHAANNKVLAQCIRRGNPRESIVIYTGGPGGLNQHPLERIRTPNDMTADFGGKIYAGEFNGDAFPDLIETYFVGHTPGYPNPPWDVSRTMFMRGGPRGPQDPVMVAQTSGDLAVGDVAGSSAADVVMSDHRGRLEILRGGRDGLSTPQVLGRTGRASVDTLLDANGDGRLDAVFTNLNFDPHQRGNDWPRGVTVLYGTGRGFDVTDPQRLAVAAPAVPRCADTEPGLGLPVAARDLTGDGVSDLLVGVYGGHRSCLGSAYLEVTGGHSGLVSSSTFLRFPLARLYPDLGLDSSSVG